MNHKFLWMFLFSSFVSASQKLKYALKGQEINFKPSINEKPDQIFWLFHDGRGVVLFDDKGEFNFPSYKDRIILDHNTAELTINNATYEDSGSYILKWNINKEDHLLKYPVEVIDNVTKPNISCKMVDQNQAFLECLTEGKSDPLLKFKWRSQGTEQTGPILKINLSDEQDVYHCDVSNPLTNETASFLAKDCFLIASSPDSLQDPQYVLKGQEINFLPSIPGKPDRVGWIHEGRDVVWFDPQTGKEDVSPSYKDRITLEQDSARLTIKDATYEDSGNYDLKLMINDQHHRLKYRIEVIDKVDQPDISCVLTSPNRVLLVCSTESKHPDLLEFKWRANGKEHSGPNLQINVRGKHDDRVYRCDVSNPLTKETANFTAGDCFLASQDLKYALKGQEINFKPSINEKPDKIFWLFHDARGVVLFNDQGEFKFPSYEDRIILDHNTAELTIYNVTYEDSGSYILRWKINNEDYRLKYPVEVIDHVTKPNISCKMVDQNQAFLECLTEGKSDPLLKFKWRSQGTEQTGPILKINLSDKQDVYHCDVSNPLTNETASFLAKDCFLIAPSPDSLQDPQYVLKGQEINFLPSLPGKPDLVGWLHDGIDVVWFDLQMGKDVLPPYMDRITLEQESARLTIKDATYEDSGNYDLKLMINDQHHRLKYRIEVIDKVDQPHILCVLTSPNRALLVCSTDSKHPDLLEFKWSSDGKEHPGPNLQINVRGKHDDRVYRCDVSNPLTKETANFTAGDCFLEPFEKTKKRIRRSPCNTPDVSQDLKYVLKGQEINFKPPIPEKPDLIIWFYHDGRGVVLFDDKGELNFPSYKDRIILNHNTAELTINNATYEDSGNYTLRWNINNEECRLKYPVEVIDKVTKPNISCEMVNLNQAVLACLTEGESDPLIKFKWRSQGYEQTGPILEINLSDEKDVYHCDVSNPLTNETASFLAKDCFRNNIPKAEIPNSTDMTSLIVVFGIMGVVLGFILGSIFCRKCKCSGKENMKHKGTGHSNVD
ncbi:muscle M-line assembly protein unc-89 isoform X2 [Syngnathus scovelli]|uniref:muscle M-line assembly protein unc-89 isoform X2 n=1 Tax=Syngnathus scovelli TaxID=161590 RepID=UPI0035CC86F4